MAWSAPSAAEFSTGEIPTASKLNAKIAANLRYLKGLDGAIYLQDKVGILTSAPLGPLSVGANNDLYVSVTDPNTINSAGNANVDTGSMVLNYRGYNDGFTRFRDTYIGDGKGDLILTVRGATQFVGLGTTAPDGPLHVVGAGGGMLFYPYSGLGASTTTILPAGSVNAGFTLSYTTLPSAGSVNGSTVFLSTPGAGANLYTDGGANVFTINYVVGGSVTLTRTAGTRTYSGSLLLTYC